MHSSRLLALGLLALCACRSTGSVPAVPEGRHTGAPMLAQPSAPLATLGADADAHAGKTLLVEATARDVCAKKGCWMQVEDQGTTALVLWQDGCDGAFTFPAEAIGERVLVQGTLTRASLSEEDAEHLREEARTGFDPRRNAFEIHASAVLVMRRSR